MIPRATRTFVFFATAALALAAVAGCGTSSNAGGMPEGSQTYTAPSSMPSSMPAVMESTDAGESDAADSSAAAASHQGNPLCNASRFAGACYPDDPQTPASCGISADAAPGAVLGCHVTLPGVALPSDGPGASVQPTCSAAGPGGEGAPCSAPTDCAATYECVGTGTCHRYCCEGDSVCPPTDFCDIQPLAQSPGTAVPVCMPIHSCALLDNTGDANSCPPTETCAPVLADGTTGCVLVGPARAGESCETEHCARGLACLGNWGELMCFTLCHMAAPIECSSGQACTGGAPMFPNPAFGVCE